MIQQCKIGNPSFGGCLINWPVTLIRLERFCIYIISLSVKNCEFTNYNYNTVVNLFKICKCTSD